MTSTTNKPCQRIALNLAVNQDGSVALNLCAQNMHTLPPRVHGFAFTFLSIDSLISLQLVDKRTKEVARNALAKFTEPMELESANCSRLLTGIWNLILATKHDPREALRKITQVAIESGVLVLKTPAGRGGHRYIEPSSLLALQKQLQTNSPTYGDRIESIFDLIQSAVNFPPHLSFSVPGVSSIYHEMFVHKCYVGHIIDSGENLYKIVRVINFRTSEEVCEFIFQATAIPNPTREDQSNAKTVAHLHEEISEGLEVARVEGRKVVFELLGKAASSENALVEYEGRTMFETLAIEALARAILKEAGAPTLSLLPVGVGGGTIHHNQSPDKQE